MRPLDTAELERESRRRLERVFDEMSCRFIPTPEQYPIVDYILEVSRGRGVRRHMVGMVAVQVKAGASHLSGTPKGKMSVAVESHHLRKWQSYGLPAVLIWFPPDDADRLGMPYWTEIKRDSKFMTVVHMDRRARFTQHTKADLIALCLGRQAPRYPGLAGAAQTRLIVRVKDVRSRARMDFNHWKAYGSESPVFGHVQVTDRAWDHITSPRRSQREVVRRLELIPIARLVIDTFAACRESRRMILSNGRVRVLYEQTVQVRVSGRRDAVVTVITERLGDDDVRFYTVFERSLHNGESLPTLTKPPYAEV